MQAAAGNEGVDASHASPARAPSAVTVGGTDISDSRDNLSNFGCVVDIFAPGVDIISAGVGCPDAAPLVSGVIATLISSDGNLSPLDMKAKLQQMAVEGVLLNIREPSKLPLVFSAKLNAVYEAVGTPNFLIQNGINFRKSSP
ncbi:hypothetical protein H0H93_005607 [Arthromyces matolae]|nr:hypothetical protein H0H93_005607 [Arthromyces matolae]